MAIHLITYNVIQHPLLQRGLGRPVLSLVLLLLASCARMGSPDGGWYDDTPPRVVSSSPADKGTNVHSRKVQINFSEFIKLEDAQSKVIVSPPQIEQAEIRASGKRILVELKDSLKPETTYTIDFSDAITDNNESNPMGNYTYSFSTGGQIDTLEVSGYCLDASNLEPIKGILVGLYPADSVAFATAHDSVECRVDSVEFATAHDSVECRVDSVEFATALPSSGTGTPVGNSTLNTQHSTLKDGTPVGNSKLYTLNSKLFHRTPFLRVSRTNGAGRFTIKGVAPGNYVAYALQDADGDFVFSQKSEMIAFNHNVIVPSWKPDTRQDTIWIDSLHIDNIIQVPYTHFLPDDVTLLCFQEVNAERHLLKMERQEAEKVSIYFTYGSDSLPRLRGLNFNADDAFVVEASQHLDTLHYWLRDTALVNQDTLTFEYTYLDTDTLGQLVERTDTLEALAKVSYEKRLKAAQKELEQWQKEQEKKKKRGESYDSIMPKKFLEVRMTPSQLTPLQSVSIDVPVPLARCDTSMIHLYVKIDTTWYNAAYRLQQTKARTYEISADWREGHEYSLEADSAAFETIFGVVSKAVKQGLKVQSADQFSTLSVTVSGVSDTTRVVVEVLSADDKAVMQAPVGSDRTADFFYLKGGTYYLRAFEDWNHNGLWDTGSYDDNLQAEPVYYLNEAVECKDKWDVSRQWNLTATPRYKQKPEKITKQKPDKAKQLRNRNAERAKEKGMQYLNGKGVKL